MRGEREGSQRKGAKGSGSEEWSREEEVRERRSGSPEDVDASPQVGESRRRRRRWDQVVGVTAISLVDVLLT